jgi:hypothetical protein
MYFLQALIALFTFFSIGQCVVANHSREYLLRTELKPGQPSKARFNGLWLEAYHTGAGLNDAVLVEDKTNSAKGFLNGTNGKVKGTVYQNQVFDLGSEFPYTMIMDESVNFYAAWEPVRINAGDGPSMF